MQNDIESDTKITEALTLQRGGNSKVVLGDLEAIPVAGRMLYVEPVYTQSNGGASFPILRHVIALYANGDPCSKTTLTQALVLRDPLGCRIGLSRSTSGPPPELSVGRCTLRPWKSTTGSAGR